MNPDDLLKVIRELEAFKAKLEAQSVVLGNVILELKGLLPITGFIVEPQKGTHMATFKTKAKASKSVTPRKFKAGDVINPTAPFVVTDDPNKPGDWKVFLTNAAGDVIDGTGIATFNGTADASGNLSETDVPPMGFFTQGNKPGPATVSGVVTITDGSSGPFAGDIGFQVNAGGPTGFTVIPA